MDVLGIDFVTLALSAASAVGGALLTYLAQRRQHQVSERSVYLDAITQVTGSLQSEVLRLQSDVSALRTEIEHLKQRLDQLEVRLADQDRLLVAHSEQVEALQRERDALRADRGGRPGEHSNGSEP